MNNFHSKNKRTIKEKNKYKNNYDQYDNDDNFKIKKKKNKTTKRR